MKMLAAARGTEAMQWRMNWMASSTGGNERHSLQKMLWMVGRKEVEGGVPLDAIFFGIESK